ncbi:MAG: cell division protein ZapD [Orrella sp.]
MMRFEYPFNERVRAWMRLEYLLDRLLFFSAPGDPRMHQVAVSTLFDVLDVTERTDVKGGVLLDLDRQRVTLSALQDHPGVDAKALKVVIDEIDQTQASMSGQGRTGQALRENDWLTSLRGRLAVPGGGTQVDMPSFHAWQCRDEARRCQDLQQWIAPLMPLHQGIGLVLRLLRSAGETEDVMAVNGAFQKMLGGKSYQHLRVWLDPQWGVFPEMSANKYMVWVRFSEQDGEIKPQPANKDVPFRYSLCSL